MRVYLKGEIISREMNKIVFFGPSVFNGERSVAKAGHR